MVEWYFYLEKGKAQGPVEKDELLSAFKAGSLGPLDLVYKKGQATWLPAFEHKDFQFLFKDQNLEKFSPVLNRKWVLLKKKKPEEGRGFRQLGPYTEKDIKDKIHSGEFSYQDYAWTSGLKKWTPIEKLEEFNPKAKKLEIAKIHPDEGVVEDLSNIEVVQVETDPVEAIPIEVIPIEAGTKDLTRPWDPDIEINIHLPPEVKIKEPQPQQPPKKSTPPSPPTEGVSVWLMRLSIFGVSVVAVTLVLLVVSSPSSFLEKIKELSSGWGEDSAIISQPAPSTSTPSTSARSSLAKSAPKKSTPKAPQSLSTRLTGGDTLEFITDGSHHFPIRVRLFGQVGKVYSKTGVYKDVRVRWHAGEKPKLSLRGLKLPKGDFVLWLTQHETEKIQGIRIEDLGGSHFKKITEAKKWQSTDFNFERRDLIFLSADYAKLAAELERSAVRMAKNKSEWQKFYSGWLSRKVGAEKARGIAPLVDLKQRQLPWSWFQLQDGIERLTQKGRVYNLAIREGSFAQLNRSKEDLTKVFTELRGDVIRTKLF